MAEAETRKRRKWGRWLLLALVVLYFAPALPYRYAFTVCNESPAGDGECYGENADFELTSVSAIVGSVFLTQVRIIRNDEPWVGLNAEDDADRARVWLALTHTGFFYTGRRQHQIDREEAWLWVERENFEPASRQFERIARNPLDHEPFDYRRRDDWWQAIRTASLAGDRDRARALAEDRLVLLSDGEYDDHERRRLYRLLAFLARQSGNFDEALDFLDQAQAPEEFYNDNAVTTFNRAETFAERYQQTASIADVDRALELFAEGERLYALYGENAYQPLPVWSEPMMMTGRAEFLSNLGRCEDAAAVLDAAITRLPEALAEEERCRHEGFTVEEINLADARCRLHSMRDSSEAESVCSTYRSMTESLCDDFTALYIGRIEATQPLACFVSDNDPDQGGSADQADRG